MLYSAVELICGFFPVWFGVRGWACQSLGRSSHLQVYDCCEISGEKPLESHDHTDAPSDEPRGRGLFSAEQFLMMRLLPMLTMRTPSYENSPFLVASRHPHPTMEAVQADDASLTMDAVQSMFREVRSHYRKTGEVDESQVCRNMMVTRVNDFSNRINRCCVKPSTVHGDGLFATRSISEGELITFFPGDALLVFEDGDRQNDDMMLFFGAHIPQSERDASDITSKRVQSYELYSSARVSAVGDPSRRDDPTYLGHFANDKVVCESPNTIEDYRRESVDGANCEPILVEGCHFALQALRPISEGEELLFSYGEGYWLARNGHNGVGTDLRCIGAPPPGRVQQAERLQQALQRARPQKKAGTGSKAKSKAKANKSKPRAARGFPLEPEAFRRNVSGKEGAACYSVGPEGSPVRVARAACQCRYLILGRPVLRPASA